MFDQTVDVAQIMRSIKDKYSNAENGIDESLGKERIICEYIYNVRSSYEGYLFPGSHLPEAKRYPNIIRKCIRIIARIIRKCNGFIIRDQQFVNVNVDNCIRAIGEREDLMFSMLCNKITELEIENKKLCQEIEFLKDKINHI